MLPFILNLPYTVFGLLIAFVSGPISFTFHKHPIAIVVKVRSLWWTFGYMKNARATTIGHILLLSLKLEAKDIEHELVHVEQYQRLPLLFPFLYSIELLHKGYRNNKYEDEAYHRAGNLYKCK